MPINESEKRIEIKPSGLLEAVVFLCLGFITAFIIIYIGLKLGYTAIRVAIPFGVIIALFVIVLASHKFYIIYTGRINTIIFNEKGVIIQNVKHEVLTNYSWSEIEELELYSIGEDNTPKEISIKTNEHIEIINLDFYSSIIHSNQDLWDKIATIKDYYYKK